MECDAKQGKMIGINFLFVSVFFFLFNFMFVVVDAGVDSLL